MDPLTHAISGAALARAFPRQRLPRRHTLFLILLTMAPDADIILRLFSETTYLAHHRGLTHSLLMLPLWGWLVFSLSSRQLKLNPQLPWLIGLALALHICLDLITTFGTMILSPLSDWRASLDLVFIIDPLFTACMLLPLMAGFIWSAHKRKLGALSLALMVAYLGLAYTYQHRAMALAKKTYPEASSVYALPLAFSPTNWQLIARFPDYYARAAVNLAPGFSGTAILFDEAFVASLVSTRLTGPDKPFWQQLPAMHTVDDVTQLPGAGFYDWFSRFPVVLEHNEHFIEVGDLAYGGGAPGVRNAFLLHIDLHDSQTGSARSWLIWRSERRSELTHSSRPFSWLGAE